MAHENVIEMRDITKVFGGFIANMVKLKNRFHHVVLVAK
ncbi:ABC transporter ATP-binding protein [Streptococcus pneumoniae]|nr:ABC transporter ATP-binding protein [Streptococcus pneumoniae]